MQPDDAGLAGGSAEGQAGPAMQRTGAGWHRGVKYLWNTNSRNSVSAVSVGSYRISAHESVGIASWRVTKARGR